MSEPGVTIVGGGIASLLLGCELVAADSATPVTLITADDPARAGGHLASWDEAGYPVEHGFHALFSCYDTALALLERHGLLAQFLPAPDHFLLFDGLGVRRVRNGWHNLLPPLDWRRRVRGLASLPAALPAIRAAARDDGPALARLDAEDFRAALLRMGAGDAVARSPLIQMFYDFGFTGDGELSAAVALSVMTRLLGGGRMLHFPGPSRDVLIEPLRRRFVALGGTLRDATRVESLALAGDRVTELTVRGPDNQPRVLPVDELVLAVDVEAFKQLAWTGGPRPAFAAAVDALTGLASLSLQAWFPTDPVPAHIDQVIGGLPEPWSTLCPVTRVRGGVPTAHGHELIACGPEAGFEGATDDELINQFFATLGRLGCVLPSGRRGVHVVVRRNRAPGERYLATRPGELAHRPHPVTPLANLCLAGAWLRVPFAMPSVEAAAQSVALVRDELRRRRRLRTRPTAPPPPAPAAPAASPTPPYPAPPYRQDGTVRMFRLAVDPTALAARLPAPLALARGWSQHLIALVTSYIGWAPADPHAAGYPAHELAFAAVVSERGRWRPPGLFPLTMFVDSDIATLVGRELYGFPKRLATVALSDDAVDVTRPGLAGDATGLVVPLTVVRGRWRREPTARWLDPLWPTRSLTAALAATGGLALYNQPAAHPHGLVRTPLTRALAHAVVLGTPVRLTDARFELGDSRLDPLRDLLPAGARALTAPIGVEVPLAFSLARPEELSPARIRAGSGRAMRSPYRGRAAGRRGASRSSRGSSGSARAATRPARSSCGTRSRPGSRR